MEATLTSELRIGQSYEQDLFDTRGNLVLSAGKPVDQQLIELLNTRECRQVCFMPASASSDALTRPYDAAKSRLLKTELEDTPSIVENWAKKLAAGEHVDLGDVHQHIDLCHGIIETDPAAVIASAMDLSLGGDSTSSHSLRMSYLAMAAASLMNVNSADIKAVGRAGLLHDISLPEDRKALAESLLAAGPDDEIVAAYRKHPLRSGELLRDGITGFSELEQVLVSQVHEQCDGSGFPRGLRKHQLHPLSRLLNIVDAFLILIEPDSPRGGYAPADALAYLILHTIYGSFDRDCIQALVTASAVYPIGTQVLLSDNSTATVMRSAGRDYLQPIVRIDGSDKLVDLRRIDSQIVGPSTATKVRRIPKSIMNNVLWI